MRLLILSSRFAYVEFSSKDQLSKATEMDGSDYNGRSLVVNEASSGGTPGGRGGGRGGFGGRGGGRGGGGGRGFGGRGGGRGGDRGKWSSFYSVIPPLVLSLENSLITMSTPS